jgi:hypothetical protein
MNEMIDTDKYEGVTRFDLVEQHNIHELAILLLDQFAEVKRLKAKLFEAELWVVNDSYTYENDIKELNDYLGMKIYEVKE